MQFSIVLATIAISMVNAIPTDPKKPTNPDPPKNCPGTPGAYDACPDGLFSSLQCCATDVLGVADLDCDVPSAVPTSAAAFQATCAKEGQRARCCAIPVAGQALLCQTPVGVE